MCGYTFGQEIGYDIAFFSSKLPPLFFFHKKCNFTNNATQWISQLNSGGISVNVFLIPRIDVFFLEFDVDALGV